MCRERKSVNGERECKCGRKFWGRVQGTGPVLAFP
jgi:hypothetical protein